MTSALRIILLITLSPVILPAILAIALAMLPIIAVGLLLTLLAKIAVFSFKALCMVVIGIGMLLAAMSQGFKELLTEFGHALETLGKGFAEGVTSLVMGLAAGISAICIGIRDGLTNLFNNIRSFFTRSADQNHTYPPYVPPPRNKQRYAESAYQHPGPSPSAPPAKINLPVTPQWQLMQAAPLEAQATYDTRQETLYDDIPVAEIVPPPGQLQYSGRGASYNHT